MGRLRDVLAWELGDHVRLIVFALSVSGLTLVLTAKVLETRVSAVPSGTGRFLGPNLLTHAILSPLGDPSPWTMLALLIPIFAILTFRYERDMGYAQSLYTLPLSKGRSSSSRPPSSSC
jgi:ABC-2 type transport system permease protein